MTIKTLPWDQRIARVLVKPLINSPITPNQLSVTSLLIALAGAYLIAIGDETTINWGAGIFVFARFFDHFDGELARQKGAVSKTGYYLDYIVGAISYSALFLGLGIGLRQAELGSTVLGDWALTFGVIGMLSAIISMFINFNIDKTEHTKISDGNITDDCIGYPSYAGFELEDGIYLIAPITWLGFSNYFFVAASIGAAIYLLWSFWCLWQLHLTLGTHQHHDKSQGDQRRNHGASYQ